MTQQDLAKLIIDSVNVWALAFFALVGVLSPAVGLITSAAISAGWLSADSGWARFAAKVFSFTMQAKSETKPDSKGPKSLINGALLVLILASSSGCAAWPWTKTAWDQWRAICGKDLAARVDVAAEASARKLDVGDFAEALCELSDVVAPFVRSTQTEARSATPPGDQAVAAARALGVMR